MTGVIRESEWDRLWAQARASGGYPPLIDAVIVPDAELDADQSPGLFTWLSRVTAALSPDPEREPEAGS